MPFQPLKSALFKANMAVFEPNMIVFVKFWTRLKGGGVPQQGGAPYERGMGSQSFHSGEGGVARATGGIGKDKGFGKFGRPWPVATATFEGIAFSAV